MSADPELKGPIQKSLDDELRALPGVLLTDGAPDFTISVIALKVVTRSRKDMGAAFSVLVTEPYDGRVRQFAELHVAPEHRDQLAAISAGAVKPLAHWVETASADDVGQVCESIVQSFVRDVLTEQRKSAVLAPLR